MADGDDHDGTNAIIKTANHETTFSYFMMPVRMGRPSLSFGIRSLLLTAGFYFASSTFRCL